MSRLNEIFEHKRAEVSMRKAARPVKVVMDAIHDAQPALNFIAALHAVRRPALIAEVKSASPSRGLLAGRDGRPFDPVVLARCYSENGAAAISVLTDEKYFGGSLDHLHGIRTALPAMPLLRKDFVCDPYQVYEGRAAGADAVLLIVAGLDRAALEDLAGLTRALGMAALVEAHTAEELDVAVASGACLIGVNSRNLHDFSVRLDTTVELAQRVPADVTLIGESGIFTAMDVARLAEGRGVDAILVGEALVTAADTATRVRELSGGSAKLR